MNCIFCQTDLKGEEVFYGVDYTCSNCDSSQIYDAGLLLRYTLSIGYPNTATEFIINVDLERKSITIFKFDDDWRWQGRDSLFAKLNATFPLKVEGTFKITPSNAEKFLNRIVNQKAFL